MTNRPLFSVVLYLAVFLSLVQVWLVKAESQELSLTIQTDKDSYSFGEEILVHGNIGKLSNEKKLSLELSSNSGQYTTTVNDIFVDSNGSYTYAFKLENLDEGAYTIHARYGEEQASTVFTYSIPASIKYSAFTLSARLDRNEYVISGKSTEGITPKNFTVYSGTSIGIELEAKNSGIMEITLPKKLIERVDTIEVIVLDYSTQLKFQSIPSNDGNSTTIRLAVPKDATSISIAGLHVAPEFPLAHLVVAVGLAGVLALFSIRRLGTWSASRI